MLYLGLDIGTCSSSLARVKGVSGKAPTVALYPDPDTKSDVTDSTVGIDGEGNVCVGKAALKLPAGDYVKYVKRLMGKRLSQGPTEHQHSVQQDVEQLGKQVKSIVYSKQDQEYLIEFENGNKILASAAFGRIGADVLTRRLAESGVSLDPASLEATMRVVLTVPAFFTSVERAAIRDALCREAQLPRKCVAGILSEPVAATLAHAVAVKNAHETSQGDFVVFDFGAGTLDVSRVSFTTSPSRMKVVSMNADPHLGGMDYTTQLKDYLLGQFQERFNITVSTKDHVEMLDNAEVAKSQLTQHKSTTVKWRGSSVEVTRQEFEQQTAHLTNRAISIVAEVLKPNAEALQRIVLVGGASSMPIITKRLQGLVRGLQLKDKVTVAKHSLQGASAMTVVCSGAALAAYLGSCNPQESLGDVVAMPISLRIPTSQACSVVIPRLAEVGREYTFAGVMTNAASVSDISNTPCFMELQVCEGDDVCFERSHHIGSLLVQLTQQVCARWGPSPIPAGALQLVPTMKMTPTADIVMTVEVWDRRKNTIVARGSKQLMLGKRQLNDGGELPTPVPKMPRRAADLD